MSMFRQTMPHPFYRDPRDPKYAGTAISTIALPPGYHADYIQKSPDCIHKDFSVFLSHEMMTLFQADGESVFVEDLYDVEGVVMLFHDGKLVAWLVFSKCWSHDEGMLGIETEYFNFGNPEDPAHKEHVKQLIRCTQAFVQTRFQVYEADEDTFVDAYVEHDPSPPNVFMILTVEEGDGVRESILISLGFKQTDKWYCTASSDCDFYELQIDVNSCLRCFSPLDEPSDSMMVAK
jgi:hypothetical protein